MRYAVSRADLDSDPALMERAKKCYDLTLQGYDTFQVADITRNPPATVKELLSALQAHRSYVAPDPNLVERVSLLNSQIDVWMTRLNTNASSDNPAPLTQAISAFVRLAKLKISIGGMAAPSRTTLDINVTHADADSIDNEIRTLTAKLNLSPETGSEVWEADQQ